jgi:sec-independent protein translocase protein TatB
MDILGIGPLEFVFILLVALIVLGPKDMVKAGKTIGRALRSIVTSDTWRVVQQASREVRTLPNRLIREAGIDELQKQLPSASSIEKDLGLKEIGKSIQQSASADLTDWTTPPTTTPPAQNTQSGRDDETPPAAEQSNPDTPATPQDTESNPETTPGQGSDPS